MCTNLGQINFLLHDVAQWVNSIFIKYSPILENLLYKLHICIQFFYGKLYLKSFHYYQFLNYVTQKALILSIMNMWKVITLYKYIPVTVKKKKRKSFFQKVISLKVYLYDFFKDCNIYVICGCAPIRLGAGEKKRRYHLGIRIQIRRQERRRGEKKRELTSTW